MAELLEDSWDAKDSGLPRSLFKHKCMIDFNGPTDGFYQVSWTFGGPQGGACTLGPLPKSLQGFIVPLTTPVGSFKVDVQILPLPNPEGPPKVWNGALSLSDTGTGSAGQFVAHATTGGPPPYEG